MTTPEPMGVPVGELSDEELERQGTHAHETRNWVFLNGTAEQFATHTARMLALEQEYLRRHPKRTWQGSGGAPEHSSDAALLRQGIRSVLAQLEALLQLDSLAEGVAPTGPDAGDPVLELLGRIAAEPGGRMHKLEVHQLARELGIDRTSLARLYTGTPALLATEQQDRVITDPGRERVARG